MPCDVWRVRRVELREEGRVLKTNFVIFVWTIYIYIKYHKVIIQQLLVKVHVLKKSAEHVSIVGQKHVA